MNKFDELINIAESTITGEVYYRDIQPMKDDHYLDPRTERNKNGLYIVKPFCFLDGQYWYVCPICLHIHFTQTFEDKTNAACCDYDGYFTSLSHPFKGALFSHLVIVNPNEDDRDYIDQFKHTVTERNDF